MKREDRESNIELLRCFLMLLVVIQHFVSHNILSKDNPVGYGDPNFISANMLLAFCVCAVNCFVLISGYFGIKFSLKKLVLFLLPIFFYELVMSLIWYPCKHHVSLTAFNYWFVRPFVALMILSPLLNKGLECLNKRQIQVILALLIAIFIVPLSSFSGNAGKNILIFILLYLTGYYIRHFYNNKQLSWGRYFYGYILCSLLVFTEAFLFARMGKGFEIQVIAYYYDNVLVYAASIFLFLSFREINIRSNIVNWVASSSFFVYIISENENMYSRPFSFYEFIGVDNWNYSYYYPVFILISSLLLFVVCILIDKIRRMMFGKMEVIIGNYISKLDGKITNNISNNECL